ncbi:carbohydrate-binding protein [Cellvibrio mixtus]|uniref:carbohydrate-binding protein n=1 Tax=Cellvibrio mixtus TaxID=39650 RepID=UPI000A80D8D8|nr:glycosyl hydrolase family 18 protein [Cellvibrio mixtus]
MMILFKKIAKKIIGTGVLCMLAGSSLMACAQTKVVGYIPSYKNMPAVIDRTDLSKLTHLNLSFLNPNASGAVVSGGNPVCMEGASASDIHYVVNKAHQAGVKVLVSIAGGVLPACSGNWQTLLQPANRATVVNNLLQFVNTFNLDGLDVDIEGVVLTNIDNAGNYTPFIQALRNGLPAGKLLTSATASYVGGMVPTSSLAYFDFVNIMSYDAIGPGWGQAGVEHSPYSMAVSDINIWKARGLTKQKLVLGVPFYGYGFNGYAAAYDFSSIFSQFGASAAQGDVIGTRCAGCSYITYNGIPTIRSKTQLALQEGSGVMIWELSQDAVGTNSLLAAIHSQIGSGNNSSSSSSSNSCPAWVSGQQYYAGNKVSYQGGYYIAEYDNPGYIPTVSPYFWEPISASACGTSISSSSSSVAAFTRLIQAEAYTAMNGVQLETTTDTGGGQNVGWIDANDWMAYANINFPASGTYKVEYRVASVSGALLSLDLNAGAIQLGQVAIPATGGWQTWTTVSHNVSINAGTYSVGIFAPQGGWNINWLRFTRL